MLRYKKIAAFVYLLLIINTVNAQTIKGFVVDRDTKQPVEYANIILKNRVDSSYVRGTISDITGFFTMNSNNSEHQFITISIIGYKEYIIPRLSSKDTLRIELTPEVLEIGEVFVKATRPISKMTASGVQTKVASTTLSEIGTGNDVLKYIPMVTGDKGNFKVFGRGQAKIYINNREVRDPSELDNLNSTDIQNVEVISNPGARYDASAKAVINIKTIRKKGDGFSFNVRSSFYTWEKQDYINQISTNYRKGGLDIFANIYYSNITSFQRGDLFQVTTLDTLWQQQSYMDAVMKSNKLNGTVGINYEIHENHYLGFRYDIKTSPADKVDRMTLFSDVYADTHLFDQWENSEIRTTKVKIGSQANLYYTGKVEELSIDFNADYLYSGSQGNGISNEKSEEYGDRTLHSASDINNELLASKIQLSYPIWKGALSIGSEYASIKRRDSYTNSELIGFSSKVNIEEQNLALFSQYHIETKIGNFSAGVRYEKANYTYFVDDTKADDKSRKYAQWFPSFLYSNQFGKVGIQLSYDAKVSRPSYSQLSSNLLYGNRFSIQTGNPFLKPTISHEGALMGVWKFIQARVSYTHLQDAIVMWIDRDKNDPKVSVINYKNIPKLPKLAAFVAIAPIFGFYKPQFNMGIEKYWQNYSEYGVHRKMKKPVLFTSLNNIFDLPYHIIVNFDAEFMSKGYTDATYLDQNSLQLNLGISKSFFNKSLRVKLAFSDITDQSQSAVMYMPQTQLKNFYHFDNREISLTVRYYFNPAKSKYKGDGAGESAKKRF